MKRTLLLLFAAVACKDQGSQPTAAPQVSEAAIVAAPAQGGAVIGVALSLTGPAASYGAQQKAGIQAALADVPVKLDVRIEDDASTKEQGITVFQKFINRDKVSAIIGPTLSNTASAADPLAQQGQVPVLAISNTAATGITDIGNYIWRDSLTEKQVIPGAFKKAQEKLHFKTAGVLYGNDDVFTRAGFDVMKASLQDLKVKTLATMTFSKPDRDYHAQLTALIAGKPDVIVVSALADNAAAIVAQARQLGWKGLILGGNGFNSPAFIKNAGAAAEGVMVGTSWNSLSEDVANQKFLAAMKKSGVNPDQFSAQAYTGILIIAEAIKQSGGKTGREDIVAGFGKIKDLDTPLGKFSFTPERDARHEPSVQQVKDGKFQIVQ
jgi:branched-chain amino acid transport system substrate-binding protein